MAAAKAWRAVEMNMLIDGRWVGAPGTLAIENPFDGSVIATVPRARVEDARAAIAAAERGFAISRRLSRHERGHILDNAADLLASRGEEPARTIVRESGKTICAARKEVARCINTLRLSAEEARRLTGETIPFDSMPGGEARRGYYTHEPVGVVLAITPYNDPLNLVAHKLGPAIASGNSVVLKPSELAPLSALFLAEVLLDAGLPPQMLNIVTGYGYEVGDVLVGAPSIRMISFTGGLESARKISKLAGLKRLSMDLGGSGPVIVMNDCDMPSAVEQTVSGAFWAAGQNCIGVQRIYVERGIRSEFLDRFIERTAAMRVGDPMDEMTDMGPMITPEAAQRALEWIRQSLDSGAKLALGGQRHGSLLHPTVLEGLPDTSLLAREEAFAPIVAICEVADFDEAVNKANAACYGIHAAVFTSNLEIALRAATELEAGGVMINDSTDYRLDAMPFGGVKDGGIGREGVSFAIREMTQTKVVCFNQQA